MKRQIKTIKEALIIKLSKTKIIETYRVFLLATAVSCLFAQSLWSQEVKKSIKDTSSTTIKKMVSTINTEVNPDYVYAYEKTKFVPPNGKKLLIMGQTVERINEYSKHFPNQQRPSGWSAYWGINEYNSITENHTNNTGTTQNHQMLIDSFPNTVLHSAMWMVGKWDIAKKAGKGHFDKQIKRYAKWAKTTNRPIYLRIGYEFDGPHNELEPKKYVKAYRRIVDLLRSEGADNIAFVWHSYMWQPYKDYPVSDWYPGDDYVDWVGVSMFGQAYRDDDFGPYSAPILDFAKQHKKPVMIAEASAVYGIKKDNNDAWNTWFVKFFTFAYNKNIRAISFINEDWTTFKVDGISSWRDARLYNNDSISKAWFMETNKEHYLKQSPELFELLGYKKDIKN